MNTTKDKNINCTGVSNKSRQRFLAFLQRSGKLRFVRNRSLLVSQFVIKNLRPLFLKRFYLNQLQQQQLAGRSMGWLLNQRLRGTITKFQRRLTNFQQLVELTVTIPRTFVREELLALTGDLSTAAQPASSVLEKKHFRYSPTTRRKFTKFERRLVKLLDARRQVKLAKLEHAREAERERIRQERLQTLEQVQAERDKFIRLWSLREELYQELRVEMKGRSSRRAVVDERDITLRLLEKLRQAIAKTTAERELVTVVAGQEVSQVDNSDPSNAAHLEQLALRIEDLEGVLLIESAQAGFIELASSIKKRLKNALADVQDLRLVSRAEAYTRIAMDTGQQPVVFKNLFHYLIFDFCSPSTKPTVSGAVMNAESHKFQHLQDWLALFQFRFGRLQHFFSLFRLFGVTHFRQVVRKPINWFVRNKMKSRANQPAVVEPYFLNPMFTKPVRQQGKFKKKNPLLRARRAFFFLRWFYNLKSHEDFWRISKFLRSFRGQLTAEQFLRFYEFRLDLMLYRSGFVPSLSTARVAISSAGVLVNGKVIDSAAHGLSPFDTVGIVSDLRFGLKFCFFKQLQKSTFRAIINLARVKLPFFEFNYSIFAFTFLSRLFKVRKAPNIHFIFPRPQAFFYWGRTFYLSRRRDLWSLTNL